MTSQLAVTLTIDDFRSLVREVIRGELASLAGEAHDVMTRDEAAAMLKVHPKVLVTYVKRFNLPAKRLGREWRFRRSELLRWLEQHAEQPQPRLRAVKGGR